MTVHLIVLYYILNNKAIEKAIKQYIFCGKITIKRCVKITAQLKDAEAVSAADRREPLTKLCTCVL